MSDGTYGFWKIAIDSLQFVYANGLTSTDFVGAGSVAIVDTVRSPRRCCGRPRSGTGVCVTCPMRCAKRVCASLGVLCWDWRAQGTSFIGVPTAQFNSIGQVVRWACTGTGSASATCDRRHSYDTRTDAACMHGACSAPQIIAADNRCVQQVDVIVCPVCEFENMPTLEIGLEVLVPGTAVTQPQKFSLTPAQYTCNNCAGDVCQVMFQPVNAPCVPLPTRVAVVCFCVLGADTGTCLARWWHTGSGCLATRLSR